MTDQAHDDVVHLVDELKGEVEGTGGKPRAGKPGAAFGAIDVHRVLAILGRIIAALSEQKA